jgi:YVTN family beta-propeller protein
MPGSIKMIKAISLGKPGIIKPMNVLLSPDATKLYVSTGRGHQVFTIDTATNTVLGSVEVGARPWGIALSPDAKTLYSANGPSNDVSVVDLATNTVTKKSKPARPLGRARFAAMISRKTSEIWGTRTFWPGESRQD